MTTTTRQNNLLLNQDWKRIYQTFKNADFKSYDFENLRRVMITYLRENYPEDFNDYIESSEYMALIDLMAFLGQSLSFRIDLASRENFIELADRKESVLRLARMLAYNAKRNIPASGLLKFNSVSTTDNVFDGSGRNLSRQTIVWNDSTNPNWQDQFLTVLNSTLANNTIFGRSEGSAVIQGIATDQYRFNSTSTDVPIYTFNKTVAGRSMVFEIISTVFKDNEFIYEESPFPGNKLGFVYRQDGRGPGSANTGFFLMFKQGSLELAEFEIAVPSTNETVSVDATGINNDDIYLFPLDAENQQGEEWIKVSTLLGNNIAYNSLTNNQRNIYSAITRDKDRVNLLFSDGVYGNLPQGNFRLYYRVSNGLSYSISPTELRGINISIPYINKEGNSHTLTISLALKYTVTNATETESIDDIRQRAPAVYYTQNRMVTAEDYNLAPLASSQNILKIKSINRTSSGISRNFDIIDASGKYSSVDLFSDDGFIYKERSEQLLSFKFTNRINIINFIRQQVEPILTKTSTYNFYLDRYTKINFIDNNTRWTNVTNDINLSTGYFSNIEDNSILSTGIFTTNTLKFLTIGSLIKFIPPSGYAFKNDQLVLIDNNDVEQVNRLWTKVVTISGDGSNNGNGILSNGKGAIGLDNSIPTGSIAVRIVPKFVSNLPESLENEMVNFIVANQNFGLRYDVNSETWKIISSQNLDLVSDFSLGRTGDLSNTNLDASWILAFVKEPAEYSLRYRLTDYIFGSIEKTRFYFDSNQKIYDSRTGRTIKDLINVLGINTDSELINPLKKDLSFEIDDTIKYEDGYQATDQITIAFSDTDNDGTIDDPDAFEEIVGLDSDLNFLFFQKETSTGLEENYTYFDNTQNTILIAQQESRVSIADYQDGQLIYFYDSAEDVVKRADKSTNTFVIEPGFKANIGRVGLKFQYIHNANVDRRIDPSVSNIIDVYLLTRYYDTQYRLYLNGSIETLPEEPDTESLRIEYGGSLESIKTISDEIIYHPAKYKILFGTKAEPKLQSVFKVVKNSNKTVNDNDLKVKIIAAINEFFDISNWDFGDRFYLGELITYVINQVAPDISNLVILPRQDSQTFGSLFEIQSGEDEIFVSGATVDDIEIVTAISAAELRLSSQQIVNGM